jgi:hypothetical protein
VDSGWPIHRARNKRCSCSSESLREAAHKSSQLFFPTFLRIAARLHFNQARALGRLYLGPPTRLGSKETGCTVAREDYCCMPLLAACSGRLRQDIKSKWL